MAIIRDIVSRPNSPIKRTAKLNALLNWDLRYTLDSKEAVIFHHFLESVLHAVYGGRWFGSAGWHALLESHPQQILFSYEEMFHRLIWNADALVFSADGVTAASAEEAKATRDRIVAEAITAVTADDGTAEVGYLFTSSL
jgi:hypothetical protein